MTHPKNRYVKGQDEPGYPCGFGEKVGLNATNHRGEEIVDADSREHPGQSNPDGRAIVKSCDCGKSQYG